MPKQEKVDSKTMFKICLKALSLEKGRNHA